MQETVSATFRSLITESDYLRLVGRFSEYGFDHQTNHYFDTSRFTLKAMQSSLRVRDRDGKLEVLLRIKKRYDNVDYSEEISAEQFEEICNKGIVDLEKIGSQLAKSIENQRVKKFLSLSTQRIRVRMKDGLLFIDKNEYLDITDYEIEYLTLSSPRDGRNQFIEILNDLNINYQKGENRKKRAFRAYALIS